MDRIIKEFYVKKADKWKEEIEEFIKQVEAEGLRIVAAEPIQEVKIIIHGRRFECEKET